MPLYILMATKFSTENGVDVDKAGFSLARARGEGPAVLAYFQGFLPHVDAFGNDLFDEDFDEAEALPGRCLSLTYQLPNGMNIPPLAGGWAPEYANLLIKEICLIRMEDLAFPAVPLPAAPAPAPAPQHQMGGRNMRRSRRERRSRSRRSRRISRK